MISRDQSDKDGIVWLPARLTGEFCGEAVVVVSALGDGVSEEHDAVLHVSCHDVLVWQEGQETENRTGVSASAAVPSMRVKVTYQGQRLEDNRQ